MKAGKKGKGKKTTERTTGREKKLNAVSELLDRHVQERPDKVAVYFQDKEITYRTLGENVNRFANFLRLLRVQPTERVMIMLPDCPFFLYAFLGSMRAGAWPVPVNTMLTTDDYRYLLENSEARVLITTPESPAAGINTRDLQYRILVDDGLEERLRNMPAEADTAPAAQDDIAFWLYSSGSTGRPKGVPHRHVDLIHTADTYGRHVLDLREDDIVFSVSRLFFAYGLGNALTFPLRFGASTVLVPTPPSPETVIETVERYRPTVFYGVPTQYNSVLKKLKDPSPFASVRICTSAGEALPPEIFRRWKEKTGREILDGIGSTEALHVFISNRPGRVRPGTSGLCVPGYEARVVDEDGRDVSPGESGHLIIRGRSITPGYWNRPDDNREKMLPDGWFDTGDMYSQEEGYFTYQGRGDDMLKVGGIWVSPVEIENVLLEHHAVHEAAVVGHDVEGLSKPFGYVALNDAFKTRSGADDGLNEELLQFVSQRLPKFKWLREVYFVEELPKTATGKIQRFKLRRVA